MSLGLGTGIPRGGVSVEFFGYYSVALDGDDYLTVSDADSLSFNDNGSNDPFVITLASATLKVKAGMIVEHATMCPRSLTDPYIVKSADGASITLDKLVAANYATGSTAQKAQFYDPHGQGYGGKILDNSNAFPKGVTIYGRWTSVEIGNGKTGSLIAYFGK